MDKDKRGLDSHYLQDHQQALCLQFQLLELKQDHHVTDANSTDLLASIQG